MSTYDDILEINKKYFGFGAEMFTKKVLDAMQKTKETLSKKDKQR